MLYIIKDMICLLIILKKKICMWMEIYVIFFVIVYMLCYKKLGENGVKVIIINSFNFVIFWWGFRYNI